MVHVRATSVTVVQRMSQQWYIVVHQVEMVVAIILQTYIVSGSQIIKATHVYFIEGDEFLMQRMLRERSEGDNGSKTQKNLKHANFEVQRKVVNSTLIIRHNCAMLLYYTVHLISTFVEWKVDFKRNIFDFKLLFIYNFQ